MPKMPPGGTYMVLRKLMLFNTILGITLPKDYTNALGLEKGQYIELYLRDNKTLVIKKHVKDLNKITVND